MMMTLLFFLVLFSLYGVVHTYLVYPWLLGYWVRQRLRLFYSPQQQQLAYQQLQLAAAQPEKLPSVRVLMAVHNEEAVLEAKMASLLAQDYPGDYQIWIGSDHSTDRTNAILQAAAAQDERLHIRLFNSRQGKPGIINQLAEQVKARDESTIFLLTDASVMLAEDVVSQLVAPMLQQPSIAMADACMIHTGLQPSGISRSEDQYIHREVRIKQAEGYLWGYTMGPFGGCYALRATYFRPVPDNFLVDDFYLCLSAYEAGGKGISVAAATCHEAVGQHIQDEFKRKVRISAGNWQNAQRFRRLWHPIAKPLGFAFFSHKILRWLTPILLLIALLSLAALYVFYSNYWAAFLFCMAVSALLLIPLADKLLATYLGFHYLPLRSLRYFIAMNAALLLGLLRYLKGIQTNVWQPSKRY